MKFTVRANGTRMSVKWCTTCPQCGNEDIETGYFLIDDYEETIEADTQEHALEAAELDYDRKAQQKALETAKENTLGCGESLEVISTNYHGGVDFEAQRWTPEKELVLSGAESLFDRTRY
ncbi:MAG: hypothetical protein K8R40_02390 [Anaerolineaceae bacterium]|nr:hypothetical protein [Anaerolineaceae bacterium]